MVVLAKVIRDWFDLLARHVRRLPSLTSSSAASSTSRAKRCTYHGCVLCKSQQLLDQVLQMT